MDFWRVVWTDQDGNPHTSVGSEKQCRIYWTNVLDLCITGKAADALLIDSAGNFVDTWGT